MGIGKCHKSSPKDHFNLAKHQESCKIHPDMLILSKINMKLNDGPRLHSLDSYLQRLEFYYV